MTVPHHPLFRPRPGTAAHRQTAASGTPAALLVAAWVLLAAAACGGSPTATVPRCSEPSDIAPGDSVEGTLDADDDRFDGARIDYYTLELSTGRQILVTQSSSEFDPLLLLFDADGEILAQAFQHDGSPPGMLETATLIRAVGAGCFLIGASVWDRGDTGDYTLTVGPAGG